MWVCLEFEKVLIFCWPLLFSWLDIELMSVWGLLVLIRGDNFGFDVVSINVSISGYLKHVEIRLKFIIF